MSFDLNRIAKEYDAAFLRFDDPIFDLRLVVLYKQRN